ncbi:MAG: polysaccharide biosynthesis C-terminal domain-containing protein [Oscillibacter sp.]|nr:polysaccharide biosynthesis C-terminal domain-containing protein [Oscillibacter sp.]MBQ2996256.1 polysaccharide biosynthesis C-terminal domain-containing protein [Oscillibacter sp.]
MHIQLSDHFTYGKLLGFTIPSIIMMIFTSIYGIVDGIFVSNFVGKTAFAALNLIMPFVMIFGALGFMLGTGGCALISKTMGEGKREKANELFSMYIAVSALAGAVITAVGIAVMRPVSIALGAEGQMIEDCVTYGRILLSTLVFFILQCEFQSYCVAAERPRMGLWITVAAGVTNIVLDAVLVALLRWGLAGAAAATAMSQLVGGMIPLVYFSLPNSSVLRLRKFRFDGRALWRACTNGSSELVSNLSMSVVNMLFNVQLLRFAGENGVAAYGVIMYVNFIFVGVFLGYAFGVAPVVSFHFGAGNEGELKSLRKKSLVLIGSSAVVLTLLAEVLAGVLSGIFVGYDAELYAMTRRGFMIYSASFLFMGFNMFASSFFTALNDGPVSALISFLRTFLFQVGAILVLPALLGLDGIWLAVVTAELLALAVTILCLVKKQKQYGY